MVNFNRCISALTAVVVVTLAMPCSAQFGSGGRGRGDRGRDPTYARNVVLSHADGLSDGMMGLVTNEMVQSLRKNREKVSVGDLLGVFLDPTNQGGGAYGESPALMIRSLRVIVYVTDEPYDDDLLEQRWEDARQKLQDALRSAQRRIAQQRVESHNAARDALALQRRSLQAQIESDIDELEEKVADDGSPEQLREQYDEMTSMLRELELDRVSVQARREAIEQRIDELRKLAAEASESDPMIAELMKIQEIRERQLEGVRARNAVGQALDSELAGAEAEMAHARIELLKAQRAAAEQASGEVLRALNNELSTMMVRTAEIDARVVVLEKLAEGLRDQTSVRETAWRQALEQRLATLQHELAQVEARMAGLESQGTEVDARVSITPLDEALGLGIEIEAEDTP